MPLLILKPDNTGLHFTILGLIRRLLSTEPERGGEFSKWYLNYMEIRDV